MGDRSDEGELEEINHRWAGRALSTGRIAAGALRLAGRRLMKRGDGDTDGLIGERLAKELDQMKGLAMKVGQILSYFDGTLPPETHAALRKLQRGAEPVAFERMRPVVEEAFGRPVDELFEHIEPRAVAAASIGQVHRAVLDGQPVAVKIQYPDVRRTFEADFSRVTTLSKIASLATAVDGPAIAAELRERIIEECDYLREAEHQRCFSSAFADDPEIVVPEVFGSRCAPTVLTSRWHDGLDFYGFAESADAERRNAVGLTLARFAYRSFFELRTLNADPHPGNYLFPADGSVVFLDFGCVRRFDEDYVSAERQLARAVVEGRRDRFRDAAVATGMIPDPDGLDWDVHWAMLRHQYAPYCEPRFRFTSEYVQRAAEYSRPSNPNLRKLAIPPPWIWQQRLQWGLHAVLARLSAEGPYADVFREALEGEHRDPTRLVDPTNRGP